MIILPIGDLHGLKMIPPDCEYDIIVFTGDFEIYRASQLCEFKSWVDVNFNPVPRLFIPGNHDLLWKNQKELNEGIKNWKYEIDIYDDLWHWGDPHGKSQIKVLEKTFSTFSWCPFEKQLEAAANYWVFSTTDYEAITRKVSRLNSADVLITHCPPSCTLSFLPNYNTCIGIPEITDRIDNWKTIICGHVHEQGGKMEEINGTKVYNVAMEYRLIEIE